MDRSDLGLKADPLTYKKCFLGDVAPPPAGVKPVSESIFAENPCIVIEGQDIVKAIEDGMRAEKAKGNIPLDMSDTIFKQYADDPNNGLIRYYLNLKDARRLCCHLIYMLADTDDRIAKRLSEVLDEEYENGMMEDTDLEDKNGD